MQASSTGSSEPSGQRTVSAPIGSARSGVVGERITSTSSKTRARSRTKLRRKRSAAM